MKKLSFRNKYLDYIAMALFIGVIVFLAIILIPTFFTYSGTCTSGNCQNAQGTYIYPSGSNYVGQWKDGKRDGQGTYTFPSGENYVGQWKDGVLQFKK